MSVSKRRVRAIFGKELREYRRNGNIIVAMVDLPADLPHPAAAHDPRPRPRRHRMDSHTSMSCCTCWPSRRSCPQHSPPTPWSASASRAPSSPCSRRRSAARNSCWARRWPRSSRRSRSPIWFSALFLACVELFAHPGHSAGAPARPGSARPAAVHPAPRRMVDLGRHRDLSPIGRPTRGRAAQPARESPLGRSDHARRAQHDPRHPRPRPRRSGGTAGPRRTRLADHLDRVRPRTSHHQHPLTRCDHAPLPGRNRTCSSAGLGSVALPDLHIVGRCGGRPTVKPEFTGPLRAAPAP